MKPTIRPAIANFSSGPCAKRPGYSLGALATDTLGRSHRSSLGKSRLAKAIAETKAVLGIPSDYRVGIVPASDTGAFEMAMWNLLGARGGGRVLLGVLRRGLGHRHPEAAQAPGRPGLPGRLRPAPRPVPGLRRPRHRLRLERHHERREGARRRLDPRRSEGPHALRRDQRRVRHGRPLGQARRGHLLLAEGPRRRGRARHAGALAPRGRAADQPTSRRGRCPRSSG